MADLNKLDDQRCVCVCVCVCVCACARACMCMCVCVSILNVSLTCIFRHLVDIVTALVDQCCAPDELVKSSRPGMPLQ